MNASDRDSLMQANTALHEVIGRLSFLAEEPTPGGLSAGEVRECRDQLRSVGRLLVQAMYPKPLVGFKSGSLGHNPLGGNDEPHSN